jgi:hypothetical protein
MASAEPWNCRLPSDAWAGALGIAGGASARTAVSKTMRRLEVRNLITRERSLRLSDVILLKEDGSGHPYDRPRSHYFQLPHAYWLEGHYTSLSLPAKVMLLVNGNRKLISCRQVKFDQFRVHSESAVSAGTRPRSRFLSR